MEKYYDIYFDPADLEVDTEGHLENPEVLQIIEFEYDDETVEVTSCCRVDEKGNVIIGVRSEFGIHLMIVERSVYEWTSNGTTLDQYYTTFTPIIRLKDIELIEEPMNLRMTSLAVIGNRDYFTYQGIEFTHI